MCGILLIASGVAVASEGPPHSGPDAASPAAADWDEALKCRGPDAQDSYTVRCGPARLDFHGSLLQLRGAAPSTSPLRDAAGNVLLFNGQIFGGSLEVQPGASDAQLLLQALGQPGADVPAVLSGLRGPWVLAFWQAAARTLWYGRDSIGRRSLLLHPPRPADGRLILASVAPLNQAVPFEEFEEVPPGLYSLQLPAETAAAAAAAAAAGLPAASDGADVSKLLAQQSQHEWTEDAVRQLAAFWRAPELAEPPAPPAVAAARAGGGTAAEQPAAGMGATPAATAAASVADPAFEATVDGMLVALRQAVAIRCRCIDERQPPTPAAAAVPSSQLALERLHLDASNGGSACTPTGAMPGPLQQPSLLLPPPPLLLPPAPVLVLFSGGVDSTLLAALAHEALPPGVPIDLASVCFDAGGSPDRLSALDALEELRRFAPHRHWRLIQVDCELGDVAAVRPRLLRLLAPADTVMDLNIGAALWLAARGEGALCLDEQAEQQAEEQGKREWKQQDGSRQQDGAQQQQQHRGVVAAKGAAAATTSSNSTGSLTALPPPRHCRSAARAVLLGHGADELCGGYGRHRTAFRERGWAGLQEELQLDLRRLWLRNLGRDDRLVADHGREARHPFLDEDVVAAALSTPLHHLADLRLPPGKGDKRVLRACLLRLGLPRAAMRAKRAIQFGSRLAAKANAAQFGGTRRANLLNAGSVRLADVPNQPVAAGARGGAAAAEERR